MYAFCPSASGRGTKSKLKGIIMTKQIKLILIASISFLLLYLYAVNSVLRFSVPSGFYDEDFYLEIKAPSKEIYYTLDGTIPTRDSIPYTEPILITDASLNENVHSMREDLSTFFLEDLIIEHTTIDPYTNIYKTPNYLIDKTTIVRAIYYDIFGVEQEVNTATYFVGYQEKSGYDTKYIISLVTEPDNLFDYETGIYVLGSTFDKYLEAGDIHNSYIPWLTNSWNKGREWEREADILIFDQDGTLILNKEVGIRIQGGWSRGRYTKNFNVYARSEYDNTEVFEFPFWNDSEYIADIFTISVGGQDDYTKFMDRLSSELIQELDVATLHYEPCILFLNGEYWGINHIAEKYTDDYFAYYYDVDPNNVVIIKANGLEEGTEEDYEDYLELKEFLYDEDLDFTKNEAYEYLWTQMDKSSTIDYFALKLYFGRTSDWTPMTDNSAFWKTSYIGDGAYEDGKWRWTVYDMNWGVMFGSYNNVDSIDNTRERIGWFDKLCENEDFTTLLSQRLFELMKEDFREESIFQLIDNYIIEMEVAMQNHHQRFFGSDNDEFYKKMEDIRTFFDGRNDNMKRFILENFGISEDVKNNDDEDKLSFEESSHGEIMQGFMMLSIIFIAMLYLGSVRNGKYKNSVRKVLDS